LRRTATLSEKGNLDMKKALVCALVALVLAMAAGVASATSGRADASAAAPGVTKKTITIGGTFPLSGPASIYAPIARGMDTYFKYVNAHGGVYGRKIVWRYYDDEYNPAKTVALTNKLVVEDKVFAIVGSLGTEHNQAIRPMLNQRKIPQVLISTGASSFGLTAKQFPWTIGWQPDYIAEGRIYGRWIANNAPRAKIAVFYQNDDYGKEYLQGVEQGLGAKKSLIVSRESYEANDAAYGAQIAKQKLSGADTWVLLTTPTPTVKAMLQAKAVAWKPDTIVINSVAASDAVMKAAEDRQLKEYTQGAISDSYIKNPGNPKYKSDAAIKRYLAMAKKYGKGANTEDAIYYYGVAKGYDTVKLLFKAGRNPTRASFMRAARAMNWVNPFALKGMRVKTSGTKDAFPLDQVKLIRYQSGTWGEISGLMKAR
jgi:branched-chain amino acid transport system substrate-binding protein